MYIKLCERSYELGRIQKALVSKEGYAIFHVFHQCDHSSLSYSLLIHLNFKILSMVGSRSQNSIFLKWTSMSWFRQNSTLTIAIQRFLDQQILIIIFNRLIKKHRHHINGESV